MARTCPKCSTELVVLDRKWVQCPDCRSCYVNKASRRDRRGDLAVDADILHGATYDSHWQRSQRRQYGADYTEPLLDEEG